MSSIAQVFVIFGVWGTCIQLAILNTEIGKIRKALEAADQRQKGE
jgi:hypothetical protein